MDRNVWTVAALSVALAALAGCQSGGSNGVLGSAGGAKKEAAFAAPDGAASRNGAPVTRGVTGTNPNAKTTLKNTRNALSSYCPAVRIREGTNVFRVFPEGADREDVSRIRYQATIAQTARECFYEGQQLKMRVGLRGRVINGPSGETGAFAMPIRVAVTEGKRTVYSRLHKPKAKIADGTSNALFSYVDEEVVIDAPTRTNVKVYVGFDEGPPKG